MNPSSRKSLLKLRAGLTLVEIMIAMSLMAIVTAGFYQLNLGTARSLFDSAGKLQINKDIRQFSAQLSNSGRGARAFYLYPQFPDGESLTVAQRRSAGKSGDFVVFMITEPEPIDEATPSSEQKFYVTKLIAYARVPPEGSREGPVFRYEREYIGEDRPVTTDADFSVETLASNMLTDSDTEVREVLQLSRGLADQRLFFNYRENALIVNGEIVHGNNVRQVTNTYNFTVTPRG